MSIYMSTYESSIYFLFVAFAFGITSKKHWINPRSYGFISMSPFKVFIILALTFMFLILSEFICIHCVSSLNSFFYVNIHFFWNYLLKIFYISTECSWYLCQKLNDHKKLTIDEWVYFSTLNIIPLIYIFSLVPVPYCINYYSFVVSFKIEECESSEFIIQDCFCYLNSLSFHYKF